MLYRAEATTNTVYKKYFGMLEVGSNLDIIITRNLSYKYPILMIRTCPSTFGRLKVNRTNCHLKWTTSYGSRYKYGKRRCDLVLTKKMVIALEDTNILLNKKTKELN